MNIMNKSNFLIKNIEPDRIKRELSSKNDKKLKDACKDFEAFFLNMVLGEMRKSLPGNALFPNSNAKKIYEYMYYDALSKEAVKERSLGIADMLYNFLKNYEK